jgi:hypothetical protein
VLSDAFLRATSSAKRRDQSRPVGARRPAPLQLLAAMQAELGDLDRVEVIDGCSDVLVEVLGKRGRGARCAVGMAELPIGIAMEIEALVQVR